MYICTTSSLGLRFLMQYTPTKTYIYSIPTLIYELFYFLNCGKVYITSGFSVGSVVKKLPANAGDAGSIHGWGRSPGEGNGNSLQYFSLGKSHRQRSLVGYSPWGSQRVRHDLATKQQQQIYNIKFIILIILSVQLSGTEYIHTVVQYTCLFHLPTSPLHSPPPEPST